MSATSFEQIKLFMRGLSSIISRASRTANIAEETAKKASTSVAEKMNAIDPAGSGSFSMNRKSGTTVGSYSHAEGRGCTASGFYSHAEGESCAATNSGSHAEGVETVCSGMGAHTEGRGTSATAMEAHAEGEDSTASKRAAHAEGIFTTASGEGAHSEGWLTEARGEASHAEGMGTIADGNHQHVQGRYNLALGYKYAHIVGNGYEDPGYSPVRSNAHTLDWDGNAWFSGNVYVGGTNQDEGKKLLTADTMPVATADTLGALKVGTGLQIVDGVLSLLTDLEMNKSGYAVDSKIMGDRFNVLLKLITQRQPSGDYALRSELLPSVEPYAGTLTPNTVYTAELSGAVAFALSTPEDATHENRIRMLANVAADTTIDWGTTYYYGAAVPYVTEGMYEFLWEYNPLIGAWVAGATRIGQVVSE